MEVGKVDGSHPKSKKSPTTKRFTNRIEDIDGAKPKDKHSIPEEAKVRLMQNDKQPFVTRSRLDKM